VLTLATISYSNFWNSFFALCRWYFLVFHKDTGNVIKYSMYIMFTEDTNIFCDVQSPTDCTLLKSDIDSVERCCAAESCKSPTDIEGLAVFTDSKLYIMLKTYFVCLFSHWVLFALQYFPFLLCLLINAIFYVFS
jgi:hypothetical protein